MATSPHSLGSCWRCKTALPRYQWRGKHFRLIYSFGTISYRWIRLHHERTQKSGCFWTHSIQSSVFEWPFLLIDFSSSSLYDCLFNSRLWWLQERSGGLCTQSPGKHFICELDGADASQCLSICQGHWPRAAEGMWKRTSIQKQAI